MWTVFFIISLIAVQKNHANSLDRRYDSNPSNSDNSGKSHTIYMSINGEQVPVVLPGEDVPLNLQHDDRVDNASLVVTPPSFNGPLPLTPPIDSALPHTQDPLSPLHNGSLLNPGSHPADLATLAIPNPLEGITHTSPTLPHPMNGTIAALPIPNPAEITTHSPPMLPHPVDGTTATSPISNPLESTIHNPTAIPHITNGTIAVPPIQQSVDPTTHIPPTTPLHPPGTGNIPLHIPETQPSRDVTPHPPEVSPQSRPPPELPHQPSQNTGDIIISVGLLPVYASQMFFNDIFGPIYPIYTQSPMVIQFTTQPTLYYMQVIQIIKSVVPSNVLSLSSIMDLSQALTNILRSSADGLDSVLVEDSDGPNIAPQIQISEDQGFRSALTGDTLDIPTPNDVSNQIQTAVQTYADGAPKEIQNELVNKISENMADLLKPLYQNIAYTRKLRFDTNTDTQQDQQNGQQQDYEQRNQQDQQSQQQQLYRRSHNLQRREDATTLSTLAAINATINSLINNVTNPLNLTTPHPLGVDVTASPNTPGGVPGTSTAPAANGALPPNSISPLHGIATSAPANQPPIVINNNYLANTSSAGTDLIESLLNSATSPLSSILSLIPNPLKIVYNIMNTIATVYPKIQLSILVGLSTAITQIIAKVLQIIAGFVGIFASIGRRDLSSLDSIPPSSLDMDKLLKDLHSDIKDAVHTYLPDAPPKAKKELTSALYSNSLDAVTDAIGPMQDQLKQQNQETQTQVEAIQPNAQSRAIQSDIFGFPGQSVDVRVTNNNELPVPPMSDMMGGENMFGTQDLGKQIDQLTSGLGQDILGPIYDPAQQNFNPQLQVVNNFQNSLWNK